MTAEKSTNAFFLLSSFFTVTEKLKYFFSVPMALK